MSNAPSSLPEPGQLVDVRRRRYVVVDLAQSQLPPDLLLPGSLTASRQHLVTLSSVEDDALYAGARLRARTCAPSRRPFAVASTWRIISSIR